LTVGEVVDLVMGKGREPPDSSLVEAAILVEVAELKEEEAVDDTLREGGEVAGLITVDEAEVGIVENHTKVGKSGHLLL
jgi:hypothetical protein